MEMKDLKDYVRIFTSTWTILLLVSPSWWRMSLVHHGTGVLVSMSWTSAWVEDWQESGEYVEWRMREAGTCLEVSPGPSWWQDHSQTQPSTVQYFIFCSLDKSDSEIKKFYKFPTKIPLRSHAAHIIDYMCICHVTKICRLLLRDL